MNYKKINQLIFVHNNKYPSIFNEEITYQKNKIQYTIIDNKEFPIIINSFGICKKNNINLISILYKFKNKIYNKKIRILGKKFVENNKKKYRLIINRKERELQEFINDKNLDNRNIVKIKLKYIKNINDYSYMFDNCIDLLLLKKIEEWNTSNVKNISWMFHNCISL